MKQFVENLSNRELSLFFWVGLLVVVLCFNREIRKSFANVLASLFAKKIFVAIIALVIYVLLLVLFVFKLGLWKINLIKDTVFWFFTIAMVLFLKINNAKDNSFFKGVIIESFKLTIFLEFVINFYNFSFITELILTPFLLVIGTMQAYAEVYSDRKPEYKQVNAFLKKILMLIGFVFIFYSFYMTIAEYSKLFMMDNLISLLLPPIFTIITLPFLYLLAVCMNYETLFVRIKFMFNDENIKRELFRNILFNSKLNLNRILKINESLNKSEIYKSTDIKRYIRDLN